MGLEDTIQAFRRKHPEIAIHLEVCPASEISLEKGESGQFDVIINQSYLISNSSKTCKEVIRSNYATLNIPEKECYVGMEAKDVLSLYNGQKLYMSFLTKVIPYDAIQEICSSVEFEPGEIITYPSIHSVMIAAKMGFGVALMDEGMFIPQELHLQSFKTNYKLDWAIAWRRDNGKEYLEELLSDIRGFCEKETGSGE